ncbi:phage protein [Selenomonas sp. TAMA-11512]|uniref:Bbp16 family capsid cement protein n=1 Tax=Selenomonas sp. TAMA-11512 TaxID=3095337 RepID=UPI0030895ADB|nr:phage protein [Selenomonas sp. TAMA-11512]
MILDKALQLSDAQAVTASAASTNYIDLKTAGASYAPVFVVATVDVAFAALTSLTISIQTAADSAFTSPETLVSSGAIPVARLTKGAEVFKERLPIKTKRYVRAYYTVAGGNATAGKITINMAKDVNIDG